MAPVRGGLALVFFVAGCASAPRPEPMLAWTPPPEWWRASSASGGRLVEKDGTAHRLTAVQVRNLAAAHEKLARQSGIEARLAIVKAKHVNAFATYRQGAAVVGFTLPFIEAMGEDADAIASVMGHELAHLRLEHGAARKQRHEQASGASNVVGTLLGIAGVPFGGLIAGFGATAVVAAFSRDEEREADELGNQWAVGAGFDPCGGARSMRVLQAKSRAASIPFLSTHPGHEERIERANALSLELRNVAC
jgi:predicted Zn-dependent protease